MIDLGDPQGPVGEFLMTRPRTLVDNPQSVNLFMADRVGNLRDPRVGNIMTLDNRSRIQRFRRLPFFSYRFA